jgi:hypothetical protein
MWISFLDVFDWGVIGDDVDDDDDNDDVHSDAKILVPIKTEFRSS